MDDEKLTPLEAYKVFIDSMASVASNSVTSNWVLNGWPEGAGDAPTRHFVASLNDEQKAVLAQMLRESRVGGTPAALVELESYTLIDWDGVTLPEKPFPYYLHEIFWRRFFKYPWPDEEETDIGNSPSGEV